MNKEQFNIISNLLNSQTEIKLKREALLAHTQTGKTFLLATEKNSYELTQNEIAMLLRCFDDELTLIDNELERLGYEH